MAKAFSEWLPTVLTAAKPWISSEDIQKGATWISSIKDALVDSQGIGVFFATKEAVSSPWLNFEAGAVASLGGQRVCVVCVDLEPGEINPPLSLFQSTRLEKEDVFKLIKTLNAHLADAMTEQVLSKVFERAWEELKEQVEAAIQATERASRKGSRRPSTEQMLVDIATSIQRVESRLSTLERASRRESTAVRVNSPYSMREGVAPRNALEHLLDEEGARSATETFRAAVNAMSEVDRERFLRSARMASHRMGDVPESADEDDSVF